MSSISRSQSLAGNALSGGSASSSGRAALSVFPA